ncbi:hypothetical protein FO519_005151 [Halicephalobus sp. NKZ332]|nr:hypothetical protein FO519_005151 [Halicephalobus sp. NKZ332]
MTVTYTLDISTSTFCAVHKLLFRWKGSIWKSILPELLLWIFCYAVLSVIYRFALSPDQQAIFEDVAEFCYTYSNYIPLTFMLGFYVSIVYSRWREIFNNLGWVDNSALLMATTIKGTDETARNIRRNIIRKVSSNVKRRFPTMDHLVTAGLMTVNELREFDSIVSPQMKYWVPINWCFLLCRKARELGLIESDIILIDVMDKIRMFRQNVLSLTLYDWVPIPLVYTQVVNLTVRSFFVVALMGRQYLINDRSIPNAKTIDLYLPIMSILQFLLFIGWMKVAEVMLNPLGDDDDDFECNWIIDRNLQVGLLIADSHGRLPQMEKDIFWNDILPEPLYTAESAARPHNPMVGSCVDLNVQPKRRISEFLIPNKWRSEQNIYKEASEETNMIQPRTKRFMSTNTVSNESLRYIEPHEVPVLRYNDNRRESLLDSDVENLEKAKYKSTVNKRVVPQCGKRLFHRNSSDTSLYVDGISEGRKLPDITSTNQATFNRLLSQLSKTEESDTSSEPGSPTTPTSKPQQVSWIVNELPVIQEEPHKEKRSLSSSTTSSGFPSKNNLTTPKQSASEITQEDEVTQTPGPYESSDVNDSFQRLKTLLRNASFTSTSSTTTDTNDPPRNQYENLGFVDWDENHANSAPGNLDAEVQPPPPRELLRRNQTTLPRRPEFRLSGSSESDNNQK